MKQHISDNRYLKGYQFQREDAIRQSVLQGSKTRTRHTYKRNDIHSHDSNQSNFSRNHIIKLNKGKKYLLEEERNTQIQRTNRMLHQKLSKCARKSQPSVLKASQLNILNSIQKQMTKGRSKTNQKKLKTIPSILPTLHNQQYTNPRIKRDKLSKSRGKDTITLFMGHSSIDEVEFKIKIIISETIYYLIAQNEHTKIILQMPQEQYWALHYQQFQQNPCNIFKYLKIEKGQISFRVNDQKKKKKSKQFQELPKGVEKSKSLSKANHQFNKLPLI